MAERITTEQVRAAEPGTMFGRWRRFNHVIGLIREVAGYRLQVWLRNERVCWSLLSETQDGPFTHDGGVTPDWEFAVYEAEESARKLFREALAELEGE